ncbi:secondary thiamine-phosphate synthase enzyme YjbQ [Rhodospirillum sp. A1_3_36]|uniref:secondary thiamine-phosphate synthase enzyme YjbQ n=1 Tax=Rhodospirillum sp. A1_3_36 TaxID=3391666 RepID=UPI0039A72FDC
MIPVTHQDQTLLTVETRGRGFRNVTAAIADWVSGTGVFMGLLTVFVRHTSASLTIQENADPDVMADLDDALARLAPERPGLYRHSLEGPDDMPAHIRAALTATSLTIPVADGRLSLGTWQGIYLCEHRTIPHRRQILLHLIGG